MIFVTEIFIVTMLFRTILTKMILKNKAIAGHEHINSIQNTIRVVKFEKYDTESKLRRKSL